MELEKLREILSETVDMDANEITEETRFDSMGLDSLDIVELLMQVDEAFGTDTQPSASLVCVGDLIANIKAQKGNA